MYSINDQQIEYILNDIRRNGVEMEDLQLNLLDHICCIIERNLKEEDDFEDFYRHTVKQFYKKDLWEIEEETITLLTFKHYYAMKKAMIVSGTISAASLSLGIYLKFMHWPGAAVCLLLGIVLSSFVFIPLLLTLKVREKQKMRDKIVIVLGGLAGALMSIGILFKVMHWPYATILGSIALIVVAVLFLPIYFFSGIRNPETKVNTIVSSLLIILGCGLFLTLASARRSKWILLSDTGNYVREDQILKREQKQTMALLKHDTVNLQLIDLSKKIYDACDAIKAYIIQQETGASMLDDDFESKNTMIQDHWALDYFLDETPARVQLMDLKTIVEKYNTDFAGNGNMKPIAVKSTILDINDAQSIPTVLGALNNFVQIQMVVLQNEKELMAEK